MNLEYVKSKIWNLPIKYHMKCYHMKLYL